MNTKQLSYILTRVLETKSEICKFLGIPESSVKSVDRTDFYDARLSNFRAYENSLYIVHLI